MACAAVETPPVASSESPAYARVGVAAAIFAVVSGLLLAFHASRLIVSIDEGILFDAAQRIMRGQRLYVDFFSYFGPVSYWLQELAFRCFGLTLAAGRLVVICDFGLQCALLYWLIARFGHPRAAVAVTMLFFLIEASNPVLLLAGHRWDSAALSLLAIMFCVEGWWIAGGVVMALAAFCTPTIGLIAVISCVAARRNFWRFAAGMAAMTAAIVAALWAGGILGGFVDRVLWLSHNYSAANVTAYGWISGGWHEFMRGAALPIRALLLLCTELPALLPIAAILGWSIVLLRQRTGHSRTIIYLSACVAGYIVSAYPRPDIGHLTIIAPMGYALFALLILGHIPSVGKFAFGGILPFALLSAIAAGGSLSGETTLGTPVGNLRVDPQAKISFSRLLATVKPGDGLYVHPYLPLYYFLTQASNPTRYAYLGPGMMDERDEASVLADLEKSPPRWVLYTELSREGFLRVFPSGKDGAFRFERIETWIRTNYTSLPEPLRVSNYELLQRK